MHWNVPACTATGVPSIHELRDAKREIKRAKTAGLHIRKLLELKHFAIPKEMPSRLEVLMQDNGDGDVSMLMSSTDVMWVPLKDVYDVEGLCFTGPGQVQWMKQLMELDNRWVLHGDGKHKLHHGCWILITLGTHHLRWDPHNLTLSVQFVPLIYLFCKQHESDGAILMLLDALIFVCMKYFKKKPVPGACMADHSDSFRNGYAKRFPGIQFGQCWPHIARKWGEGEWVSKTWEHFGEVAVQLYNIHLAKTAKMRDLLMMEYGELWDQWNMKGLRTFWNGYCVDGWDNWSVGPFNCAVCTPSQQACC